MDYFKKGLELSWIHPIEKYLKTFGITPGDSYSADTILNSILAQTGFQAAIQCDKFEGKFVLREIKICFDKNFETLSCENQGVYGSCPREGLIFYPRDQSNTSNGKMCKLNSQKNHKKIVIFFIILGYIAGIFFGACVFIGFIVFLYFTICKGTIFYK